MKGMFLQENLSKGMEKVSHLASSGKGVLPILGNILFKMEKGLLYLISTNLEIAIETCIRGKVEISGSFTIPASLFSSHLNFLPNESLNLELKGNEICLKYKNGETKIKGLPPEDFPLIPRFERREGIKISGKDFKKSLQQVMVAVSFSETRPEISGIFLNKKGNKLTLVGTDSYRLAEKIVDLKEETELIKKAIVPIKACQELFRILNNEEDVEIFFSENQIFFSQGSTSLISRVVQADFPNYQEIIPLNFKTRTILDKENLTKIVKGIAPFSRLAVNDISLDFFPEKGKLIISSLNTQIGEARVEAKAEIFGEKNSLSLNYRYLLEGLSSILSEEVSLEMIDDSSPVLIKPHPEGNFLYLLMPIKT